MKKYIALFLFLFILSSNAYSQSEPPYGMSEIGAYSIFYENYRTGNYEMALQFGKWILEKKPRELEGANRFNLPTQFDRMIKVYEGIAEKESDPTQKAAYLDTAITIYDEAFETFDEETIDYFDWYFKRGRFYQEHNGVISNAMDRAYADYERAYELDAERLTTSGDGYYIRILLDHYVNNDERDKALAMIETVEPYAGSALADAINETRNNLFSDPVERIEFLESRLENNPEDEELISELADLYESQGDRAMAIEYAEKLYNLNSNFENTRKLADYALADAQYEKALNYLQEALEKTDDNSVKRDLNLEIAETYQNTGNLRSARTHARQAAQLDRNSGRPYLRIASIYASAVSQCTSGRTIERDDRTVYWLVLDYLDRARSTDSSTASAVQRQYQSYEPVLPSSEDKFFRGWETGDEINIGSNISDCYAWIDETTTVR